MFLLGISALFWAYTKAENHQKFLSLKDFFRCLLSFSNLFLYVLTAVENFQDSSEARTSISARKIDELTLLNIYVTVPNCW